ncbi:MAG: type II toxin-antitoxin system PemK/MazF family toxin [Chitinivibrionales bacterium]|nr:type II toxin-antitoxin system PemK/MazF family toxin [Chitinivibrionales bacterium]
MKIIKYHIYLADLNPCFGTEPGKTRPVVVLQTDLLNNEHPSTIICPITTNVVKDSVLLRVHVSGHESGLKKPSDILVDQIRAIDNRRLIKEVGRLSHYQQEKLVQNIKTILFE